MKEKTYKHLLILCGIFCQGIIGTLSNEDTKESSDFLVRKKRVINHEPGGNVPTKIEAAPYIVNIKANGISQCVGTILSHYSVITAASCVEYHISAYEILSGSGYAFRSKNHSVTWKESFYGNPPHERINGISLITVDPPFTFSSRTKSIPLHVGVVRAGTLGTVSGWGSWHPTVAPMPERRKLRSIILPLLDHGVCANIYRGDFRILDMHLCTYHTHKCCAITDTGAPLVINNMLAGIYIWKGDRIGKQNPDVFVTVQHPNYSAWINQNALLM